MKQLERIEDFKNLLEESKPFLIFKHSTICPVSAQAHRNVEKFIADNPEVDVYGVLVIENRPLSNHIAEFFSITHQSPQAFLINNKKVIWNASHLAITETAIEKELSKIS